MDLPGVSAVSSLTAALLNMGVPAPDVDRMLSILRGMPSRRCAAGESLIREGDPPGDAFLVQEGLVEVLKRRPDGSSVKAAELGPGSLVGEMSLLTEEPRSATVRAKGEARVLVLGPRLFALMLLASPGFAESVRRLAEARNSALARRHAEASEHFPPWIG